MFILIIKKELKIIKKIKYQLNDHDVLYLFIILDFKKYFNIYYLGD